MTTFDRYMMREIGVPFAVGLALFFVVVSFGQLLKVSDSVTGIGVRASDFLVALLYSFPPLMGLLLPVACFFAILLAIGRLASDLEVVGLGACGLSPYRLLRIPFWFGFILALICGCATILGEPWGIRGLKDLMAHGAQRALAEGIRVGEFNEWVKGVTILAHEKDNQDRLSNVFFADRRDPDQPVVVSARKAIVRAGEKKQDIVFDMFSGSMLLYENGADSHRLVEFERGQYRVDVGKLVNGKLFNVTRAQSLSPAELWVGSRPSSGKDQNARALYLITLHRKFALPLATIIFALMAVPLGCRKARGARARGFLLSTVIVAAYYYLGRAFELAARAGDFPPHLAAWVPNGIGIAALTLLLIRFRRVAA